MWTYYQQTYPNGMWMLFREDEAGQEEAFHRQNGWQATDQLSVRRAKGDVESSDEISAALAEELVNSVQPVG